MFTSVLYGAQKSLPSENFNQETNFIIVFGFVDAREGKAVQFSHLELKEKVVLQVEESRESTVQSFSSGRQQSLYIFEKKTGLNLSCILCLFHLAKRKSSTGSHIVKPEWPWSLCYLEIV